VDVDVDVDVDVNVDVDVDVWAAKRATVSKPWRGRVGAPTVTRGSPGRWTRFVAGIVAAVDASSGSRARHRSCTELLRGVANPPMTHQLIHLSHSASLAVAHARLSEVAS
jgi:hypothetical protein